MLNFSQKILAKEGLAISFLTGQIAGEDVWCYAAFRVDRYDDFLKEIQHSQFIDLEKLRQYATIIAQGYGTEAPDDVKSMIQEKFGISEESIDLTQAIEDYRKSKNG